MPVKVKRGLGLLVVAVLAVLPTMLLVQSASTAANVIALVTGTVMYVSAAVGLVLIAWGLLRD
jgi:hypothetical protein